MTKLLKFDAFTLLICEKNVTKYALLRCKTYSLKIWVCKIFDKFHVWSRCVKMFKFQSANIRFTNNTAFKRNVKIIVRYMDLRVIFGNQFLDVGETNNWVLQLENLLMQSDWNLKVDITPRFPV